MKNPTFFVTNERQSSKEPIDNHQISSICVYLCLFVLSMKWNCLVDKYLRCFKDVGKLKKMKKSDKPYCFILYRTQHTTLNSSHAQPTSPENRVSLDTKIVDETL